MVREETGGRELLRLMQATSDERMEHVSALSFEVREETSYWALLTLLDRSRR